MLNAGGQDVFVSKQSAAGSALAYSTSLGGNGGDEANGIALGSGGNFNRAGSGSKEAAMKFRNLVLVLLVVLAALTGRDSARQAPVASVSVSISMPPTQAAVTARISKLPLRFEANAGQWDPRVQFVARQGGATLFITDEGMTIGLRDVNSSPRTPGMSREDERAAREKALSEAKAAAISMKLVGARPSAPKGEQELVTKSNFLLGNDKTKWRTSVPNYGQVRAKDWVPGVDVVWHGGENGLEYDVEVAAGVDARELTFEIEGADRIDVAEDGSLEIATAAGVLVQKPPKVMQSGQALRTRYVVRGVNRVAFAVDGYDGTRALLIDPVLTYSTYLGGSGYDEGSGVAVGGNGSAYVTGQTLSTNFPTASAYQGTSSGSSDAFVAKLNASGNALVYSTYFGGTGNDYGNGIAVDGSGNAYVTGRTGSTNFPTASAYQAAFGGTYDAFVTKLNASGNALVYSTYLGGTGTTGGSGIAVDAAGSAYVTGYTGSTNFPTASGYQGTYGGSYDAFATKLSAAGSGLIYSTYLGGGGNDYGIGIAVDASGSAYVTGQTSSTNFPTASAYQAAFGGNSDAFVTKLSAVGSTLTYSTYLGGAGAEQGLGIAVDAAGGAYVTGYTGSTNFPTASAYQAAFGGNSDAFMTKLSAAGSALIYSTYLGGGGNDYGIGIAVDASGSAYVTGSTASTNFPTASAYQSTYGGGGDAFVAKLANPLTLSPTSATVAPKGSQTFTASGGSGGYSYSLQTNASGGAINASTGAYTAGVIGNVTDTVQVTDSLGNVTTVTVSVGPGITINPSSPTSPPKGSLAFSASGGSGTGYTWSLTTNNSGGSINASTGAYTAGATVNVADTASVADSLGNTASVNVSVGGGLAINPASPTSPPKGSVAFSATGGSVTGFVWSMQASVSGGSINASTGAYTAGVTGSVTDIVKVTDSLSNSATVNVTVTSSSGDGGVEGDGGTGTPDAAAGGGNNVGESSGCGCTVIDEPSSPHRGGVALLLALGLLSLRRRRTQRLQRRSRDGRHLGV